MKITPDLNRLVSGKLSRTALHSVLGATLLTAASLDCGNCADPDCIHPEFGMAIASNLAISRLINPDMAWLYETVLADYIRFSLLYIEGSYPDDKALGRQMRKALIQAIREAYKERKKELLKVQNFINEVIEGQE